MVWGSLKVTKPLPGLYRIKTIFIKKYYKVNSMLFAFFTLIFSQVYGGVFHKLYDTEYCHRLKAKSRLQLTFIKLIIN